MGSATPLTDMINSKLSEMTPVFAVLILIVILTECFKRFGKGKKTKNIREIKKDKTLPENYCNI